MSSNKPRVSIGLPVFNGENFLKETLDSIMAQTYSDFELIISDNASTDSTQQICLTYASKDRRIRYYRNKRNLGACKNFNRLFKFSSGEYFKWAAHDDVLAPEFLAKCIDILDSDPSIVLCHSKTGCIDEQGKLVSVYPRIPALNSQKPQERFAELITFRHLQWAIFGLIRANVLRMTSLIGSYIGSDKNLLTEIGLIGRIYEIPEFLFFRRMHPQSYSDTSRKSNQEDLYWWTTEGGNIILLYMRNILEYFKSVGHIPLKWSERLSCYAKLVKWFTKEGWILVGSDLENILSRSSLGRKLALVNPLRQSLNRRVNPIIKKNVGEA